MSSRRPAEEYFPPAKVEAFEAALQDNPCDVCPAAAVYAYYDEARDRIVAFRCVEHHPSAN